MHKPLRKKKNIPRSPKIPPATARRSSPAVTAGVIGFAVMSVSYLVLYFLINSSYVYTAQQPIFFTTGRFFADTVQYPGGLATYFGLLLSQCFYYNWLGAAVFVMLMGAIYASTLILIRLITGTLWPIGALIPFAFLFPMHCSYFHLLEFDIKILFLCTCGIASFPIRRIKGILGTLAVTALLLIIYAVAGASVSIAGLVMLFCIAIYNDTRNMVSVLVSGAAGTLIIGIAYWTSLIPNPLSEIASTMTSTHYGISFLPGIVLLYYAFLPLGAFFARKYGTGLRFFRGRVPALCAFAVIVVLGFAGAIVSYDPTIERCLRFDRYAQEDKWESILTAERGLPDPNVYDIYFLCRSLYHEDMFINDVVANPNFKGQNAMVFDMAKTPCLFSAIYNSDLFFEMGATNLAIRWALEAVNNYRCLTPRMLQRLTLCYASQGKIEMARSLVDVLSTTLIGRSWARSFAPLLDDSLRLASNDEIRRLRMLEPVKAYISWADFLPYEFRHIWLHSRTFNKMAFEYSLALVPELLNEDIAFTDLTAKCRAGDGISCLKIKNDFANTRLMYDFSEGK